MNRLVEGVRQFHEREFPRRQQLFAELADRQQPQTLFIACADSRIVPELITQTQPGELFVCRNIGNIVPAYGEMMGGVSAVVEYACTALGVTDIVVCGHTDCGAMKALLNPADPTLQTMPTVASWLRNAEAARSVVAATYTDPDDPQRLQRLVEQNVRTQLSHLGTHPAVAGRLAAGQLALHGWVYDIEGGGVSAIDAGSGALVPLASTTIRGRATAV
ncbi:carbonic anhydrase [Acidisphaera sp. L21]|uniref:carbonic anhydrase n=1 Tax=Acidisphaera sp. L21 TaxID=1641851 RepID=UPI001575F8DC|nr:carbonic anhydrase [Acidisphaera sp. L21]